MSKMFLIADTHFGDERILKYENRPFDDVIQMDGEVISSWNTEVSDDDEVYILGDFGAVGYEEELLSKLNGKKYLIKGNHDLKSNEEYRRFGFSDTNH